jgi:hypothetical protein
MQRIHPFSWKIEQIFWLIWSKIKWVLTSKKEFHSRKIEMKNLAIYWQFFDILYGAKNIFKSDDNSWNFAQDFLIIVGNWNFIYNLYRSLVSYILSEQKDKNKIHFLISGLIFHFKRLLWRFNYQSHNSKTLPLYLLPKNRQFELKS